MRRRKMGGGGRMWGRRWRAGGRGGWMDGANGNTMGKGRGSAIKFNRGQRELLFGKEREEAGGGGQIEMGRMGGKDVLQKGGAFQKRRDDEKQGDDGAMGWRWDCTHAHDTQ